MFNAISKIDISVDLHCCMHGELGASELNINTRD